MARISAVCVLVVSLSLAAILGSGCNGTAGPNTIDPNSIEGIVKQIRDLSGFQRFEFKRIGCPSPLNWPVHVVIEKQQDGSYLLSMSILKQINEGSQDCDADLQTVSGCMVLEDLPDRVLTNDEVQQMLDLFSNVEVWSTDDYPQCVVYLCYDVVTWDNLELNDAPTCNESIEFIAGDMMETIIDFLRGLQP